MNHSVTTFFLKRFSLWFSIHRYTIWRKSVVWSSLESHPHYFRVQRQTEEPILSLHFVCRRVNDQIQEKRRWINIFFFLFRLLFVLLLFLSGPLKSSNLLLHTRTSLSLSQLTLRPCGSHVFRWSVLSWVGERYPWRRLLHSNMNQGYQQQTFYRWAQLLARGELVRNIPSSNEIYLTKVWILNSIYGLWFRLG